MVVANSHVPPWEPSPEVFLKGKERKRKEGRQRQRNLTPDTHKSHRNPIKSLRVQEDDGHLLLKHDQSPTCGENASCKSTTITSTGSDIDCGEKGGGDLSFAGNNPDTVPKKSSRDISRYYSDQAAVACEQCFEEGIVRWCCNHVYCRYCYEKNMSCPNCHRSTTGGNAASSLGAGGVVEVRDGEECRGCLQQGFRRKCCEEFYCSMCYFKDKHCPSCQTPTEQKILFEKETHIPSIQTVAIGYGVSLLICTLVITCAAIGLVNNHLLPSTLYGFNCYGFFPSYSDLSCVSYSGNLHTGIPDPLMEWKACTIDSPGKVFSQYCVYDEQLYVESGKQWGYDMKRDSFLGRVTVFQDTFDAWLGNTSGTNPMASGQWVQVVNGVPGNQCGTGGESLSAPPIPENTNALYFSGAKFRFAETVDVDIRYGGHMRFWVKFGPLVFNTDSVCKPADHGDVQISSSVDGGRTWEDLYLLETWRYRKEAFTELEVSIPPETSAASSSTRFRFEQYGFSNDMAHWALDDLRIESNLMPGWSEGEDFFLQMKDAHASIREAQCCLNSEQCSATRKVHDKFDCQAYQTVENKKNSTERALLGAERFIVLAGFLVLFRWVHKRVKAVIQDGWETLIPSFIKRRRHAAKVHISDDSSPFTKGTHFDIRASRLWRILYICFTAGPAAVAWMWCAALLKDFYLVEEISLGREFSHPWNFSLKLHVSGFFLLATVLDALVVLDVARNVVCLLPGWVPRVGLDFRPSGGWLQIGDRRVRLRNIKSVWPISTSASRGVAIGYILGAWPWCLIALLIKYNYPPYFVSRFTTPIFGSIVVLRAWVGGRWLLETVFLLRWLLTIDMEERDQMGYVLLTNRSRQVILFTVSLGLILGVFVCSLVNVKLIWIAALSCSLLSFLYGVILVMIQGLPITPKYLLTDIGNGTMLRIHHQEHYVLSERNCCKVWSELYSRDLLISLFVQDSLTFSELLRSGDSSISTI